MENKTNVVFQGKIVPVKPLNSKLTLAKCYVMAIGVNKHRSDITREAAEDAIPTLFNIPVVGHLYLGEDGNYHMGGHDKLLVKDENGKYKFKVLTVPFGVVPQQDNVHFEEVEEADSTKSIILSYWKRLTMMKHYLTKVWKLTFWKLLRIKTVRQKSASTNIANFVCLEKVMNLNTM